MLAHPTRIRRKRRWRRRARDRQRLLELLPKHAVCAEVGTWRGDFAAAILDATDPHRLYVIDAWEHRAEAEYEHAIYGGQAEAGQAGQVGQAGMDAIHERVLARFQDEIERGRVEVRRARSLEAAAALPDASLDWVYIDADHSYEGVKADLDAYHRLVKPGGFIAGDDYGHDDRWFGQGVTRAVDEVAARYAQLTVIGSQFMLRKR